MKMFKKITAVILAVIAVLSLGVVSFTASAAAAPKFEVKLVSQTADKATVQINLVSGEFNSVDFQIKTSDAIKSINYILTTAEFDKLTKEIKASGNQFAESSSAATGRISLASTGKISKPTSIYEISVSKATAADIMGSDITLKVVECVISNGASEERVASQVTVSYAFGKIEIEQTSIELNYKSSAKLNIDTSYSKENLNFKSGNTNVATIDDNGNVYASGKGSTTITVETKDGSLNDTCNVTVKYAWWQWIIVIVLFGWIWY